MQYTIIVHDDDRAECPDQPWAAYCADDGSGSAAGLGATPEDAVRDLLDRSDGFAPTLDAAERSRAAAARSR